MTKDKSLVELAKEDKKITLFILGFLGSMIIGSILLIYAGIQGIPTYYPFMDVPLAFLIIGLLGMLILGGVYLGLHKQRVYAFLWAILAIAILISSMFIQQGARNMRRKYDERNVLDIVFSAEYFFRGKMSTIEEVCEAAVDEGLYILSGMDYELDGVTMGNWFVNCFDYPRCKAYYNVENIQIIWDVNRETKEVTPANNYTISLIELAEARS